MFSHVAFISCLPVTYVRRDNVVCMCVSVFFPLSEYLPSLSIGEGTVSNHLHNSFHYRKEWAVEPIWNTHYPHEIILLNLGIMRKLTHCLQQVWNTIYIVEFTVISPPISILTTLMIKKIFNYIRTYNQERFQSTEHTTKNASKS